MPKLIQPQARLVTTAPMAALNMERGRMGSAIWRSSMKKPIIRRNPIASVKGTNQVFQPYSGAALIAC